MATAKPTEKPTRVRAERLPPEADPDTAVLDRIAWMMDSALRIPGTKIRFGLDPIAGIIPIFGDIPAGMVQGGLILLGMYYYKLPKSVIRKMVYNVLLDTAVGSVPVLGTIFDVGFKANMRNMKLLREALEAEKARRRTTR